MNRGESDAASEVVIRVLAVSCQKRVAQVKLIVTKRTPVPPACLQH